MKAEVAFGVMNVARHFAKPIPAYAAPEEESKYRNRQADDDKYLSDVTHAYL